MEPCLINVMPGLREYQKDVKRQIFNVDGMYSYIIGGRHDINFTHKEINALI